MLFYISVSLLYAILVYTFLVERHGHLLIRSFPRKKKTLKIKGGKIFKFLEGHHDNAGHYMQFLLDKLFNPDLAATYINCIKKLVSILQDNSHTQETD